MSIVPCPLRLTRNYGFHVVESPIGCQSILTRGDGRRGEAHCMKGLSLSLPQLDSEQPRRADPWALRLNDHYSTTLRAAGP